MEKREIMVGHIYRHFKGKDYRVLGTAEHTETGEILVINLRRKTRMLACGRKAVSLT